MKIICFGDSNTYGYNPYSPFGGRYEKNSRWTDILAEKTGWEVINQGENGRSIPGSGTILSLPEDTDWLIVMLGTNDILQGWEPKQTAEHMEIFLLPIVPKTGKILLIAPPPMAPGQWVSDPDLIDRSAALSRDYRSVAERLHIRFADAGSWNIELSFDGKHFTPQGHLVFADSIYKEIIK